MGRIAASQRWHVGRLRLRCGIRDQPPSAIGSSHSGFWTLTQPFRDVGSDRNRLRISRPTSSTKSRSSQIHQGKAESPSDAEMGAFGSLLESSLAAALGSCTAGRLGEVETGDAAASGCALAANGVWLGPALKPEVPRGSTKPGGVRSDTPAEPPALDETDGRTAGGTNVEVEGRPTRTCDGRLRRCSTDPSANRTFPRFE